MIENKIKEFKKFYKLKNKKYDDKIEKIIKDFIINKKLIIYGGSAIDILLKSRGHKGIYDYNYDYKDYDVFSLNALEDIKELAEILKNKGFKYLKITAGVSSNTYRLFIDINRDSSFDITNISIEKLKKLEKLEIYDNIIYDDPNHIKVDQYRNLSCQLFKDINRYEKISKRILLLEKYFPMKENDNYLENINLKKIKDIEIKKNYIFVGDLAYNYYMDIKNIDNPFVLFYSYNENHLEYKEEMLYKEIVFNNITLKIGSIDLLLHTYYNSKFDESIGMIKDVNKKINNLLKIRDKEDLNELQIFIPKQKIKYENKISSIYLSDF
jgi:hypothetical protein